MAIFDKMMTINLHNWQGMDSINKNQCAIGDWFSRKVFIVDQVNRIAYKMK